jgi:hypothetical protein
MPQPELAYPAVSSSMPSEIDTFMYLTCREYAGLPSKRGNPNSIPVYRTIRLPLPQDVARSTGNQYSAEDSTSSYNIAKRSTAAASQGVEKINPLNQLGMAYNAGGGGIGGGIAALVAGGAQLLGGFGIAALISHYGANTALDAVSELTTSRRTMMSQEMTWKNTEQRDFTFKWSLVPRNAADLTTIPKICAAFEAYSLGQRDTLSPLSRILAPMMWTIECKRNDGENVTKQILGQPKLCGISDVSVVNDTKSMAEEGEDGSGQVFPMKTELVVKFTEIEPILFDRRDDKDGDPTDSIKTRSESFAS